MPTEKSSDQPERSFAIVSLAIVIKGMVDEVWNVVGDFHGAGRFLNLPVENVGCKAQIGSVRQIGADIVEVMVGASLHSYTYAQITGPMARHAYHGSVALRSLRLGFCDVTYTLIYDQSSIALDERRLRFDQLSTRFTSMVNAMKTEVETYGVGYRDIH